MGMKAEKMLRQREVQDLLGISPSTLWRLIGSGTFPKGKKITNKLTGWTESSIAEWQANLADSDAKGATAGQ